MALRNFAVRSSSTQFRARNRGGAMTLSRSMIPTAMSCSSRCLISKSFEGVPRRVQLRLGKNSPPKFTHYPKRVVRTRRSVKVKIHSTPDTTCFRALLRKTAHDGQLFAGHYALGYWGCGTCLRIGIFDLSARPRRSLRVLCDLCVISDQRII